MTNGWGAMGDYSAQVPVADRWRIAAYIRALQLSQTAKAGDVAAGSQITGQRPSEPGTGVVIAAGAPVSKNTEAK
jgi:hypothetical protein